MAAAQNEVVLSYHRVRGYCFIAVIVEATIVAPAALSIRPSLFITAVVRARYEELGLLQQAY